MRTLTKEYATGISFDGIIYKHNFPLAVERSCILLFETKELCFPRLSIDVGDKVGISGENGELFTLIQRLGSDAKSLLQSIQYYLLIFH